MKIKSFLFTIAFLSIFFGLVTSSQASTDCILTTALKQGMKGEQVTCLQQKLNITADGKFGKNTKTSVITFQTSNNLKGDGIVGKLTRDILNKKEVKLPCAQGDLFNTITGQSCTPLNVTSPVSISPRYFVPVASRYLDITYIAGSNGSISGSTSQRIIDGGNGTAVTATPDSGYVFDTWSDGVLTATRTDTNVTNDKIVTATFIPTIAISAIAGVTAPVTGATPTATIADTVEYTATISWNTNPVTFASNTIYTATITITPKTGYTLSGVPANFFTVAGATATNAINTGVVSAVFPVTDTTISATAIAGVTAPVTGATPVTTVTAGTGYTGTVTWSGSPVTFAASTIYTATITLTPTAAYTLTGVTTNQFTIAGATSATNSINSGVITAVFPETVPITDSTGLTYGTVTAEDGRIWLDRNLGATQVATAFNDYNAYGSLFQWGRGADGHQLITHTSSSAATAVNGDTSTLSTSDTPGDNLFIKAPSSPYDWRSPQNDNLWQGVNGINNPCPTGFRLPTSAEWSTLITTAGITNSATAYSSTLKLTVGGYRDYSDASLYFLGTGGYYWSSSTISTRAYFLSFDVSSASTTTSTARAEGYSVRCIKD
ncbi:peptidoglycan-binding protein [Candidatus Nomurabacteria bacterium]|nr:peptidoglycan-binding protein [Candidatus Nomurabacteria bacterium]